MQTTKSILMPRTEVQIDIYYKLGEIILSFRYIVPILEHRGMNECKSTTSSDQSD